MLLALLAGVESFRTVPHAFRLAPVLSTATNFDLETYLDTKKRIVDQALDRSLTANDKNVEKIIESMRYSLLAGGKRVRPILVLVIRVYFLIATFAESVVRLPARCSEEAMTSPCPQPSPWR